MIQRDSLLSRRGFLATASALASSSAFATPRLANSGSAQIVATTGMVADLVREIGGSAITVKGLMGEGIDPHSYRPTRSDIVQMARADSVFWHGLYLEAQFEEFFEDLSARKPVHAIAETLDKALLLGDEDYENRFDPHIWMDPRLWAGCIPAVQNALSELIPQETEQFERNAARFNAEAMALHDYSVKTLQAVAPERRVLLTAHDAFGYFGAAYGFEVLGIQGISTESEAGLNRISTLVDEIVQRKLPAVFVETSVSDRNIRALIEGAAAQGHQVEIGGALFSDAMGAPGSYEGSWLGMIDHNVTTIAAALGADIPSAGRLGRLGAS